MCFLTSDIAVPEIWVQDEKQPNLTPVSKTIEYIDRKDDIEYISIQLQLRYEGVNRNDYYRNLWSIVTKYEGEDTLEGLLAKEAARVVWSDGSSPPTCAPDSYHKSIIY